MLGLLLARAGVSVVLLESHHDFDREFRGDTVHPSTLEILDQLGLAERLHALPHSKVPALQIHTPEGIVRVVDFEHLRTKFPYILMLPQALLLELLTNEAKRYPSFELVLGANVQRLIREGGVVRGVAYRDAEGRWHEVRAVLTVAADGRFSKLRHLAGIEMQKTAPPMDVVWFRLPTRLRPTPPIAPRFTSAGAALPLSLTCTDHWKIGYVILKGSFSTLRNEGLPALGRALAEVVPWLADRVGQLQDWQQVAVLNVESSLAPCWHQPGLLLIGDAAHVMSPVGGLGINYAVQDAVETANLLTAKLRAGAFSERRPGRGAAAARIPGSIYPAAFSGYCGEISIAAPGLDPSQEVPPALGSRVCSRSFQACEASRQATWWPSASAACGLKTAMHRNEQGRRKSYELCSRPDTRVRELELPPHRLRIVLRNALETTGACVCGRSTSREPRNIREASRGLTYDRPLLPILKISSIRPRASCRDPPLPANRLVRLDYDRRVSESRSNRAINKPQSHVGRDVRKETIIFAYPSLHLPAWRWRHGRRRWSPCKRQRQRDDGSGRRAGAFNNRSTTLCSFAAPVGIRPIERERIKFRHFRY